jgi:hypothetical protein
MSDKGLFSLTIDPVTKTNLAHAARWARMLAIFGIILLLLMVVFVLLDATLFANSAGRSVSLYPVPDSQVTTTMRVSVIGGTIIGVIILFFPLLFLFRFSGQMKKALAGNDQQALNTAFHHLKLTLRYIGIFVIVVMVIYLLLIVLGIMGADS